MARNISLIGHCLEDLKLPVQILVQLQYTSIIPTPITIIRRAPHRHQILLRERISITFIAQLMGSTNQHQIINMGKFVRNFCTKQPTRSSFTYSLSFDHLIRITPHQITEGAFMRNFYISVNCPNLIHSSDIGA